MSKLIVYLDDKEVSTDAFMIDEEIGKKEVVRKLLELKKDYLKIFESLGISTFALPPETPHFYDEKGVVYRNRTDVRVFLFKGFGFPSEDITITDLLTHSCKIEKDNGEVLEGSIIQIEFDGQKMTLYIQGKEQEEVVYFEKSKGKNIYKEGGK